MDSRQVQWNSFNFYLSTFGVISDHIDDLRRKIIGPWLQPLRSKTFFACRFLVNIQECTVMYFEQQLGGDICHFIIFFCLRIIIDRSNHRFGENTSYPFVFLSILHFFIFLMWLCMNLSTDRGLYSSKK